MAAAIGNKYAIGNNGGRPPLYNSPEEMIAKCDEYFLYILGEFHMQNKIQKNPITGEHEGIEVKVWDRMPEPATVTGLALFLGFDSKQSLYDYGDKQEFTYLIKKARTRIENEYEKGLYTSSPTGAIFALKNMGWKDKTEVDNNLKIIKPIILDWGEDDI